MAAASLTFFLLLPTILLSAIISPARTEVSISLVNQHNPSQVYQNYSHKGLYDSGFSREVYKTGYLHRPGINDCNNASIVPAPNSSWIAVVANYSSCFEEQMKSIASANCSVVIINSDVAVRVNIRQHEVPVVVVSTLYMEYLNATLSDFDAPQVTATIVADNALIVFLLEVGTSLLLLVVLCFVAVCYGLRAKWHSDTCCSICCGCLRSQTHVYQKVPYNDNSSNPLNTKKDNLS